MRLVSHSETETESFGESLAPHLRAGDLVVLTGSLGAGKTRFVAGIARGLAAKARVRSPTYTLVNEYHGRITLRHVDLYRLELEDVPGLALDEAMEDGAVVVEWGERLSRSMREEAMEVRFEFGEGDVRRLQVVGERGRAAELARDWCAGRGAIG